MAYVLDLYSTPDIIKFKVMMLRLTAEIAGCRKVCILLVTASVVEIFYKHRCWSITERGLFKKYQQIRHCLQINPLDGKTYMVRADYWLL